MTPPIPPTPPPQDPKPMSFGDIIARIYPDLRRLAAAKAASQGVSPTSLAQETVCRLISLPEPPKSIDEAMAISLKLLQWTGVDRARPKSERMESPSELGADGGNAPATPPDAAGQLAGSLRLLARHSPRKAELLMLASLCGMPEERIAAVVGISPRTVRRELTFARAWIAVRMKDSEETGA